MTLVDTKENQTKDLQGLLDYVQNSNDEEGYKIVSVASAIALQLSEKANGVFRKILGKSFNAEIELELYLDDVISKLEKDDSELGKATLANVGVFNEACDDQEFYGLFIKVTNLCAKNNLGLEMNFK